MAVNPVTGTAVTGTTTTSGTSPASAMALPPSEQLNEQDFLTLLAAELQYQDPTNPVNNTQFIGELAQFSSLAAQTQQETTLEQILTRLNGPSGSSALLEAAQLIGKTVTTTSGTQGTVTGVITSSSGVAVELQGGNQVAVSDLKTISRG
jgi:flagellar basal-body rod modification protein FlgD